MIRVGFALLLMALAAPVATAGSAEIGALRITAAWARATPNGAKVGGGYLTITNTGTTPDRFLGGSSRVSKRFELHEMKSENGVMKMRPLPNGIEIKPGQTVTLKPGGEHIMLVDLNRPLKQGDYFKATLDFEKAGKVDVDFSIEGIAARGPATGQSRPGGTMNMKGMH